MCLQFQVKGNRLYIRQDSPIEFKDIVKYGTTNFQSKHEGDICFGQRFTLPKSNIESFEKKGKVWVILDEFVFPFDKSIFVQI
jgi:hypothetical protein